MTSAKHNINIHLQACDGILEQLAAEMLMTKVGADV